MIKCGHTAMVDAVLAPLHSRVQSLAAAMPRKARTADLEDQSITVDDDHNHEEGDNEHDANQDDEQSSDDSR